jgi:cytochrome b561
MEPTRYTRTAIALHWLIAIAVITNVALALIWPYLADDSVRPVVDARRPCRRAMRAGR